MTDQGRVRLQAYLPADIAEVIKLRAEQDERPESWELLRIIKLGIAADGAKV